MRRSAVAVVLLAMLGVAAAASCDDVSWTEGPTWYGDGQLFITRIQKNCETYIEQNDLYNCQQIEPFTQCESSSDCPDGSMCFPVTVLPYCVVCPVLDPATAQHTKPPHSWSNNFTVITNVTEAMINNQFWTVDDFYDHRGVDEIKTQSKWSWSPNKKAIQFDSVVQHRSTWGDRYDSDDLRVVTEVVSVFNATHVHLQTIILNRFSYDTGDIKLTSENKDTFMLRFLH